MITYKCWEIVSEIPLGRFVTRQLDDAKLYIHERDISSVARKVLR
jgi:hypothetical protein